MDAFAARVAERIARANERASRLRAAVAGLAVELARRGATRVVLVGSLARADVYNEDTDVDLVVWGLSLGEAYEAGVDFGKALDARALREVLSFRRFARHSYDAEPDAKRLVLFARSFPRRSVDACLAARSRWAVSRSRRSGRPTSVLRQLPVQVEAALTHLSATQARPAAQSTNVKSPPLCWAPQASPAFALVLLPVNFTQVFVVAEHANPPKRSHSLELVHAPDCLRATQSFVVASQTEPRHCFVAQLSPTPATTLVHFPATHWRPKKVAHSFELAQLSPPYFWLSLVQTPFSQGPSAHWRVESDSTQALPVGIDVTQVPHSPLRSLHAPVAHWRSERHSRPAAREPFGMGTSGFASHEAVSSVRTIAAVSTVPMSGNARS